MSIAVQVEVKSGSVLAALSRLSLEPDGRRELLDMIGAGEADNTRLRFSDQTGPDGRSSCPPVTWRQL